MRLDLNITMTEYRCPFVLSSKCVCVGGGGGKEEIITQDGNTAIVRLVQAVHGFVAGRKLIFNQEKK